MWSEQGERYPYWEGPSEYELRGHPFSTTIVISVEVEEEEEGKRSTFLTIALSVSKRGGGKQPLITCLVSGGKTPERLFPKSDLIEERGAELQPVPSFRSEQCPLQGTSWFP